MNTGKAISMIEMAADELTVLQGREAQAYIEEAIASLPAEMKLHHRQYVTLKMRAAYESIEEARRCLHDARDALAKMY